MVVPPPPCGWSCFPPPPFDDHPTLVEFATTTAASERRDLGSLNKQSQQVLSSDTASQLHKCLSVGNQNKAVQERQAAADGRLRQRCLATAKAPGGATYSLWCVALSPNFHLCRCLVKVTSNCRRRECALPIPSWCASSKWWTRAQTCTKSSFKGLALAIGSRGEMYFLAHSQRALAEERAWCRGSLALSDFNALRDRDFQCS